MIIKPICPKCGYEITIKINKVIELEKIIKDIKAELHNTKGMQSLNDIFKGFKK